MLEGNEEAHLQEMDIRVVLDSNVWIAHIRCRELVHSLFKQLESVKAELVVPGIILEEVWRNVTTSHDKARFMAERGRSHEVPEGAQRWLIRSPAR